MAIKLQKPTEFGDTITREYWKIGVFNAHPRTQSCFVVLDGYVNAAARKAGKHPIGAPIEMVIPWSAFSNDNNPNVRDAYNYIKALEEWAAGEEV